MNITVATKWSELNLWQLEEISYLFFHTKECNFDKHFFEMVKILFQKNKNIRGKFRISRLYGQVPYSTLAEYGTFLQEIPDLYRFPKIKKLSKPGDRLNNLSIKQFSVADALYYEWRTTENEIKLRQLVASLYTFKSGFDKLRLPEVANITDKIPLKRMYAIGMTYLSVRHYIFSKFTKVFPKPKENADSELMPNFRKKEYTPFSKIITTMAMDERQPLGNLAECNKTLLYDFLNTLEESIIRVERENKQIKN